MYNCYCSGSFEPSINKLLIISTIKLTQTPIYIKDEPNTVNSVLNCYLYYINKNKNKPINWRLMICI